MQNRCNHQTAAAVIIQIKVHRIGNNHVYITVDAAVEREVSALRIHPVIGAVVHIYFQHILILQSIRDIHTEG